MIPIPHDQLPGALSMLPPDVPGFWGLVGERFAKKRLAEPHVVIHGGYGKRNMGDDAILHVLYTRVRQQWPHARITVVSHGPENVKAWYPDVEALGFKSLKTLRAAMKADLYIIGGGGIVNRINTYSGNLVFRALDPKGKFQFIAALVAGWTGGWTHYYAIGAESFPDKVVRALTRFALKRAGTVSVRDPRTLSNLREIGVKREIVSVLDPALSLEPAPAEDAEKLLRGLGFVSLAERVRPLVALNFRWVGDPAVDNERTLSEAARLVTRLRDMGCDVVFLPISQHPSKHLEDDLDFGRRLKASLGGDLAVLETYPHPTVYMALLGQMDLLILSRLHAVILGSRMGAPIVTVSYDDKVSEFVKLSGQAARMIELKDFTVERLEPLLPPMVEAAS